MKIPKLIAFLSVFCIATPLFCQNDSDDEDKKVVDNNLSFKVIDERVRTRGMMRVCITDTSMNCISNLQSGFEVRVYDENNNEIWAGKTAGRIDMLKFPEPFQEASYIKLRAFKPFVLNKATGTRIYQDKPIEIKYNLDE